MLLMYYNKKVLILDKHARKKKMRTHNIEKKDCFGILYFS